MGFLHVHLGIVSNAAKTVAGTSFRVSIGTIGKTRKLQKSKSEGTLMSVSTSASWGASDNWRGSGERCSELSLQLKNKPQFYELIIGINYLKKLT